MPNVLLPLASGRSVNELEGLLYETENNLPEWTEVELLLNMRWRFPGFDTAVGALNFLLQQAGVEPWAGTSSIATADPNKAVVYIHWTKGQPWILVIAAIILKKWILPLSLLIGALVLGWIFFKKVVLPQGGDIIRELIADNPALSLFFLLGGLSVVMYAFGGKK